MHHNTKIPYTGDIVIPIHLASTFARLEIEKPTGGYEYSRSGNPTRDALEERLAELENAKHGLAFASGLAAETTLLLTLLKTGDHVVASDDLYGGTHRLFDDVFSANFGISLSYVDSSDSKKVAQAVTVKTKLIWLETPTNPLLKVSDIKAIAAIARKKKILLVVDNTFATPYFQKPLELGAEIVLHSTTKYINGHSDSIGGAIMVSDEKLYQKLKFNQNAIGAILSPFDSYLVLRGIKTFELRMAAHDRNGKLVAQFLSQEPNVEKIYYPGFGGMVSFELKGGMKQIRKFLKHLKIFALAESLGGTQSLIEHPGLMTHSSISKKQREKIGISDSLLRVSVGIEDPKYLIADLTNALAAIPQRECRG